MFHVVMLQCFLRASVGFETNHWLSCH